MASNIKYLVSHTNPLWLALTACGLACCLISLGTFDGSITAFSSAQLFGVRIGTDLLSGGIPIMIAGAAMALAALFAKQRLHAGPASGAVLSAASAAGLVLLFLDNAALVPSWAGEVGGALLTLAAIVTLGMWAQAICTAGIPRTLLTLSLAFIIETVLDLLIENALVDTAGMVVLALIVATSPLLLVRVEGVRPDAESDRAAKGAGEARSDTPASHAPAGCTSAPLADTDRSSTPAPAPLAPAIPLGLSLTCVFIWGFLMGRVQCVGSGTETSSTFMSLIASNAAGTSAVFVALFCLLVVNFRHAFGGMRIAVLAMLACALYFSGTFGVVSIPVGMVAMGTARMMAFIYIWMLGCHLVGEASGPQNARQNSPALVLCGGWALFTFANTLSTKAGLLVDPGSGAFLAYNVAIMAALAALIVVEFLPRRDAAVQGSEAQPEPAVTGEDALLARCEQLARAYALTDREREVLVPLVRGRSASTIAAQLSMSTETARTHIRHIYQKTDIHSREELMDIVDGM